MVVVVTTVKVPSSSEGFPGGAQAVNRDASKTKVTIKMDLFFIINFLFFLFIFYFVLQ